MKCYRCQTPITFDTGGVEFISREGGYPDYAYDTRMLYLCEGCEPVGYHIDFVGLLRDGMDGPKGWLTHISRKTWCSEAIRYELADAFHYACAIRPVAQSTQMRSVVASIPRRRPPTPRNPRAITVTLRSRVMERDGFRCRRCGCGPSVARLVVDHITPVAAGGTADFDNLQTLCHPCNAGKSDRAPTSHDTVRA